MTSSSSGPAPPPLPLRIAAVVAIAYGTVAAVETLASLAQGEIRIDLCFLGIPIGSGLLQGRESTRTLAVGLSFLMLLATVCLIGWLTASGRYHEVSSTWDWISFIPAVFSCLVFVTLFCILQMTRVRAWFSLQATERSDATGWVAPLVIGIAFSTSYFAIRHHIENAQYPVHSRFEFFDANTGARLRSVGHTGIPASDLLSRQRFAPKIRPTTIGTPEGLVVQLDGFAWKPVTMTFISDGYQPQSFTLDSHTPPTVALKFQPLSAP